MVLMKLLLKAQRAGETQLKHKSGSRDTSKAVCRIWLSGERRLDSRRHLVLDFYSLYALSCRTLALESFRPKLYTSLLQGAVTPYWKPLLQVKPTSINSHPCPTNTFIP